jgi:hypothetical protein
VSSHLKATKQRLVRSHPRGALKRFKVSDNLW